MMLVVHQDIVAMAGTELHAVKELVHGGESTRGFLDVPSDNNSPPSSHRSPRSWRSRRRHRQSGGEAITAALIRLIDRDNNAKPASKRLPEPNQ